MSDVYESESESESESDVSLSHAKVLAATGLAAVALLSSGDRTAGPEVHTAANSAVSSPVNTALLATSDEVVQEARAKALHVHRAADSAAPPIAAADLATRSSVAADLPETAARAYQRAAIVLLSVKPGCHLDWALLAAIGQIESDHGRAAGATLRADGTTSPAVRGVALDGRGKTPKVVDTDDGRLDGHRVWDRAVGPMQFLPSTWRYAGVDGDGDGLRRADDLDDSALGTGVFLCAWSDDVATSGGMASAVQRFNPSRGFVAAAGSLARAHRERASDTLVGTLDPPSVLGFAGSLGGDNDIASLTATQSTTQGGKASQQPHSPSIAGVPTIAVDAPAPTTPTSGHRPGTTPQPFPTGNTAASPGQTPTTGAPPSAGQDPAPDPTPNPDPAPDPDPDPTPDPTPSPRPSPSADPIQATAAQLSGTIASCGPETFCLDGHALELGSLTATSSHDHDNDGDLETRRAELEGMVGTHAVVEVDQDTAPAVVRTLNGWTW